jgi:hypothetical protein
MTTLAMKVRLPTVFSLLISAVGSLSLCAPGYCSTSWAAIALPTVTTDANSE